jgi:hypothetical protein
MLREILDPLLRNPHCAHAPAPAPVKRESVLHSTLFSAAEEKVETIRTETAGWAHPGKTDDAVGGV